MSTIKSSDEHLTLNADGSSKDIKFQANGVEKASISSAGAFTSTTIDATKLTGNLPAVNGSALTNLTAANLTGALPAISGASLTGLPAGGITEADQHRLTTSLQSPSDGVTYITQNWERVDTDGFGKIGTGMSEAAGVWTFPSTGVWLITFNARAGSPADARYITARINTTTDNSSYDLASISYGSLNPVSSYWYTTVECKFIFDVTSTSTHKVKFSVGAIVNDVQFHGGSNQNETYVTFLKLGET
jgi:hypothetical protein